MSINNLPIGINSNVLSILQAIGAVTSPLPVSINTTQPNELPQESKATPETFLGRNTEDTKLEGWSKKNIDTDKINTASQIIDVGSKLLQSDLLATLSEAAIKARGAYDAISNAAMSFAPYGTVAGLVMKTGAGIYDAINLAGAKKADNLSVDNKTLETVGGSYTGTVGDMVDVSSLAGLKFGLFNGKRLLKTNNKIKNINNQLSTMDSISSNAEDWRILGEDMADFNNIRAEYNLTGGYDLRYNLSAKQGAKLEKKEEIKTDSWSPVITPIWQPIINFNDINSFKLGGQVNTWKPSITELTQPKKKIDKDLNTGTTLKNIIPEGALHKNKHHLKDIGFNDKGITKKGIPVVDNDGHLLAEIEVNEIVFTLEVTKKLEEGYHKYYDKETSEKEKEELAFKAGKLLWYEILYNTDDRTGLIDTLKLGGVLNTSQSTKSEVLTEYDIEKLIKLTLIKILK